MGSALCRLHWTQTITGSHRQLYLPAKYVTHHKHPDGPDQAATSGAERRKESTFTIIWIYQARPAPVEPLSIWIDACQPTNGRQVGNQSSAEWNLQNSISWSLLPQLLVHTNENTLRHCTTHTCDPGSARSLNPRPGAVPPGRSRRATDTRHRIFVEDIQ